MTPEESGGMPTWAADLRVTVAEIRGETRVMSDQIPQLLRRLEELRANTVPMHEHVKVLQDVEVLKERDVGSRAQWEEMTKRVPILWDERARFRGALALLGLLQGGVVLYLGLRGGHIVP